MNKRDCTHGRQIGKCSDCDIETLEVENRMLRARCERLEMEVKTEREECARLAEVTVCDTHIPTGVKIYGYAAGKAIRARSTQ